MGFSLGHFTVVVATGVLVIAGAGFVQVALDGSTGAARVLGLADLLGLRTGLVRALTAADTTYAGFVLAGFFALVSALLLWRRGRPA